MHEMYKMLDNLIAIYSAQKDESDQVPVKISKSRSFYVQPVLPSSIVHTNVDFIKGFVLEISNKKLIGQLLRVLPPLPAELCHLKRVNGNLLLTSIERNITNEERIEIAKVLGTEPEFTIHSVPRNKPSTKMQLNAFKKHWPMSFHCDPKLDTIMKGTLFSASEISRLTELFIRVERIKGALFYDPTEDKIVCEGICSGERPLFHPVMQLIESLSKDEFLSQNNRITTQYLATGFYAVLAMEPCTMCAMALVHSRVKRVFFGAVNVNFGALFSKWRLQESKAINHHFDVFQIIEKTIMFNNEPIRAHPSFRVKELFVDRHGCLQTNLITSSNLFDDAEEVAKLLDTLNCHQNEMIGVLGSKNGLLISMVMGIIKTGKAFAIFEQVPANYLEKQVIRFRIRYIICDALAVPDEEEYPNITFMEFGKFKIGNLKVQQNDSLNDHKILYAIQTSGSTGEPKIVLVPSSAIIPNIDDFIDRFLITEYSSILFATSLSFDPSMVELLMAMKAGCELIIPPTNWIGSLSETIFTSFKFSFIQLTPAVLQCFPVKTLRLLIGSSSSVEHLLIGGDNFPLNLLMKYFTPKSSVSIYNVYGLTEVSCWASIHKFQIQDINKYPGLVPIGHPLLATRLEISTDGKLIIYGRKCIVNFEPEDNQPTYTEDEAFSLDSTNGQKQIFIRGRYKPNSILPTFMTEVEVLASFAEIVFAKLIYVDNCRFLFADHADGISSIPDKVIRSKLSKVHWPTRIFWNVCKHARLSTNGKIDEEFLHKFVSSDYRNKINLQNFFVQRFGILANEHSLRESLPALGIKSIEAAEITFVLDNLNSTTDPSTVMGFILDERNTFADFLNHFSFMAIDENLNRHSNNVKDNMDTLEFSSNSFVVEEKWSENLGKCIDGTPVCLDGTVYATSHSGILKGIELLSGKVIFEYVADGDRFESGCSVHAKYLAVGGFSGRMYLFDQISIPTEPLIVVECQSEIRMTPIFDTNLNLFWGSYQGWIWRLHIPDGKIIKFDATNQGFLRTNPFLFNETLVFGTLGGRIFQIDQELQGIIFEKQLDAPIFAPPIDYKENLLVLTIKGSLHLICPTSGNNVATISLYEYGGSFFDSPTVFEDKYLAISSSDSLLLLTQSMDTFTVLRRLNIPKLEVIVRRPIPFGHFLYLLTKGGTFFRISVANLLYFKQCFADQIFSENVETFTHPLILTSPGYNENAAFIVVFGARDDILRAKFCVGHESADE